MQMKHVRNMLLMVALLTTSCSDDDGTSPVDGGGGGDALVGDSGGSDDGATNKDKGPDSIDPQCPMPGPCIREITGEGKHTDDVVLIGEILTLTGEDLQDVVAVTVGAANAPILSGSATQIVCRVGPKTPPGQSTVEVHSGDSTRKFKGPTVRRLVLIGAADASALVGYYASSRSAFPPIDLEASPVDRPTLSPGGRFAVVKCSSGLLVVNLPLEEVTEVGGLSGETITSWRVDSTDSALFMSTESGKLLSADLDSFPTLTASPVTGSPAAVGVSGVGQLLAGLRSSASQTESSLWSTDDTLQSFDEALIGDQPFVIGSGSGLSYLAGAGRDGSLALLVDDGGQQRLGVLTEDSGKLKGIADLQVSAASSVTLSSGGAHVALSTTGGTAQLSYLSLADPSAVKTVVLTGSGSVVARHLPTLPNDVLALVGNDTLQVVDLDSGTSLGPSDSLGLSDVRDSVGDPVEDKVHLVTLSHFRSFGISINNSTASLSEIHPYQQLSPGKDYRWIVVQP